MSLPAIALLGFGAAFELVGIFFVASPDLFPPARRLSAWLRLRVRPIVNRVLRLLGRPRSQTVTVGAATGVGVALSASAVTAVSDSASLEAKVEFLRRRDQDAQRRENELVARLSAIEGETPERLEELRRGMEAHVAEALDAAHREYREVRILGVVLLALGLAFVTAANFL